MPTIDDLNIKLLSELREIAGSLGIPDHAKLPKKELINRIVSQQAAPVTAPVAMETPELETSSADFGETKKQRRFRSKAAAVLPAIKKTTIRAGLLLRRYSIRLFVRNSRNARKNVRKI
jgi:transcription termination factor Rho